MEILIIGCSAAGLNALDSFRHLEPKASVTLVSAEPGPVYGRVLLPYFLRRRLPCERLVLRREEELRRLGARCLFGARVEEVEARAARVRLGDGRRLPYDRLLVATGSRPVKPPVPGLDGPGVFHLWTLEDALRLDPLLQPGRRLLVLGSGFIALQAAWAALVRGLAVTVFELLPRIMPKVLDARSAGLLAERIRAHGVDLRTGVQTEAVERDAAGRLQVSVRGEAAALGFDLLIVGTGVRPNSELLLGSLPDAARGIPVDPRMRTGLEGIYAAGDVALGPSACGEPHVVHALWPTAVEHGKVAGQEMAGRPTEYRGSLNMNVTQMFGATVASMGRFAEEQDGVRVWERLEPEEARCVRVLTRGGVPVGASVVGESADAALLGRLRPYVRLGRPLPDAEALLSRVAGAGPLARPAGLRTA